MNIYFAEKLRSLREQKDVSQEKLARYLCVSFQAVSKWENSNAYPDITLLPEIARFFGVTVDELLCVEKIDERKLFDEYSEKAGRLFRLGRMDDVLALWKEAYKKMPNSIDVKEMLMSTYFDNDRKKYFNEFVEIATEVYESDARGKACNSYYKGQAISELARCYAERGDMETAWKWASKSFSLFNSREIIEAMIDSGDDLVRDVSFCTHWFLEEIFAFAVRLDDDKSGNVRYKQKCLETAARAFELFYPDDDMDSEQLLRLAELHKRAAERETSGGKNKNVVSAHLERADECRKKSTKVKRHTLTHPLLYGWEVDGAPEV